MIIYYDKNTHTIYGVDNSSNISQQTIDSFKEFKKCETAVIESSPSFREIHKYLFDGTTFTPKS